MLKLFTSRITCRPNISRILPKPLLDDLVTGEWLPVIGSQHVTQRDGASRKKDAVVGRNGSELTDELDDFASGHQRCSGCG
jgi:hypothetical protein